MTLCYMQRLSKGIIGGEKEGKPEIVLMTCIYLEYVILALPTLFARPFLAILLWQRQ